MNTDSISESLFSHSPHYGKRVDPQPESAGAGSSADVIQLRPRDQTRESSLSLGQSIFDRKSWHQLMTEKRLEGHNRELLERQPELTSHLDTLPFPVLLRIFSHIPFPDRGIVSLFQASQKMRHRHVLILAGSLNLAHLYDKNLSLDRSSRTTALTRLLNHKYSLPDAARHVLSDAMAELDHFQTPIMRLYTFRESRLLLHARKPSDRLLSAQNLIHRVTQLIPALRRKALIQLFESASKCDIPNRIDIFLRAFGILEMVPKGDREIAWLALMNEASSLDEDGRLALVASASASLKSVSEVDRGLLIDKLLELIKTSTHSKKEMPPGGMHELLEIARLIPQNSICGKYAQVFELFQSFEASLNFRALTETARRSMAHVPIHLRLQIFKLLCDKIAQTVRAREPAVYFEVLSGIAALPFGQRQAGLQHALDAWLAHAGPGEKVRIPGDWPEIFSKSDSARMRYILEAATFPQNVECPKWGRILRCRAYVVESHVIQRSYL